MTLRPNLIHTGGTIGMTDSPDGLLPHPGLVEGVVGDRARVISFEPLLDSAAIGWREWNCMLDMIEADNGPTIVTHGTDTMTYTGAALAQALHGRMAPVVLCGSMVPLGAGGDAEGNLDLALSGQAGQGVWLVFNGRLMPAGNLVKHDSHGADAFQAIPADEDTLPPPARRFAPVRVGILTLTPGIPASMLAAALGELDAAVIRVFGAGTAPPDRAIYHAISEAVQQGKLLRAVSACETGGLTPGAYAAGAALWQAGVQNGGRDTAEAAFIRLWLALSAGQ